MRRKGPHLASLDEVRITRNGDEAVIEYADPNVWTTPFRPGPEVLHMSDQEILDQWNDCLRAREQAATEYEYEHVAVEIPPGKPPRPGSGCRASAGGRAATGSAPPRRAAARSPGTGR